MTAFVWFDLLTSKTAETRTFYNELLGWPISTAPSESGYESWLGRGSVPWAGIKAIDATPGTWLPYVRVDDLEASRDRAVHLGGTPESDVITGPAGQSLVVSDPSGARIALFVPTPT